jgi:hypothetical protein
MTLTIDIDADTEKRLRDEASRTGIDAERLAAKLLSNQLEPTEADEESQLLLKINEGWPEERWQRYKELIKIRDKKNLSDDEHAELIALTDDLEGLNARRIGDLAQLAKLRGIELPALMEKFGIRPRSVE